MGAAFRSITPRAVVATALAAARGCVVAMLGERAISCGRQCKDWFSENVRLRPSRGHHSEAQVVSMGVHKGGQSKAHMCVHTFRSGHRGCEEVTEEG